MKRVILCAILGFLAVGIGTLGYRHFVPQGVIGSTIQYMPMSFEQIDSFGIAVIVRPIRHTGHLPRMLDGEVVSGFTFTEVVVEKVLRGPFEPGDRLSIAERFVPVRYPDGLYYLAEGPYLPMQKGHSYLVYLGVAPHNPDLDDHWVILGGFQGKFRVPSKPIPALEAITARDVGLNYMVRDWVDNVWIRVVEKYFVDETQ